MSCICTRNTHNSVCLLRALVLAIEQVSLGFYECQFLLEMHSKGKWKKVTVAVSVSLAHTLPIIERRRTYLWMALSFMIHTQCFHFTSPWNCKCSVYVFAELEMHRHTTTSSLKINKVPTASILEHTQHETEEKRETFEFHAKSFMRMNQNEMHMFQPLSFCLCVCWTIVGAKICNCTNAHFHVLASEQKNIFGVSHTYSHPSGMFLPVEQPVRIQKILGGGRHIKNNGYSHMWRLQWHAE